MTLSVLILSHIIFPRAWICVELSLALYLTLYQWFFWVTKCVINIPNILRGPPSIFLRDRSYKEKCLVLYLGWDLLDHVLLLYSLIRWSPVLCRIYFIHYAAHVSYFNIVRSITAFLHMIKIISSIQENNLRFNKIFRWSSFLGTTLWQRTRKQL